jgi:hypothetical protein
MVRITGHTLAFEGAAHRWNGRRYERITLHRWSVSGRGRALCSCGEVSPILETGNARKDWHRGHKLKIANVARSQAWPPERVKRAIRLVHPFVEVSTYRDGSGNVQVTMSFDDLCSFVEWICGSMSEFDLDGFVTEELSRTETMAALNEAAAKEDETG